MRSSSNVKDLLMSIKGLLGRFVSEGSDSYKASICVWIGTSNVELPAGFEFYFIHYESAPFNNSTSAVPLSVSSR